MSVHDVDPTSRRALVFTPMENRREVVVEAAVRADELGYEAVVVPEGWAYDATVLLAEIALRTERIRIVAGVLSPWGRSPGTIAMAAATLDELSCGRFVLGLGASTPALAERFHGQDFRAPAARLGRWIDEVRRILSGGRATDSSGRPGLRLGLDPRPRVPIWVAGLGPRTVEVAMAGSDAWFPALLARDAVDDARRRAAGSAGERRPVELVCGVLTAADSETATGREAAAQLLGWYLTGMGSIYGDQVAATGRARAVAALRQANPRPRFGAVVWPPAADDLLEPLTVFGDGDGIRRGLRRWDALVDVVGVCIGPAPLRSLLDVVEAAAPRSETATVEPHRHPGTATWDDEGRLR